MRALSLTVSVALLAACGADPSPRLQGRAVEPMVLFVHPDAGLSLELFDRSATRQTDLASALALGDEYEGIRVTADGQVMEARPPAVQGRVLLYAANELPGAQGPPPSTQIVVRAARKDAGGVRVVGLDADGNVTFDFDLAGAWDWFQLSPTGRYLFADDGIASGVVIDVGAPEVVWQGPLRSGAFTRDDQAFAFVHRSERVVVVRPLPRGDERRVPFPAELGRPALPEDSWWGARVSLRPVAPTPAGHLFETAGESSYGVFLWLLGNDDSWQPVDPLLARYSVERALGLSRDGRTLVFERTAVPGRGTAAPTGLFARSLDDGSIRRIGDVPAVFGGDRLYRVVDGALRGFSLQAPDPVQIARVAQPGFGWQLVAAAASDDGERVAVASVHSGFPNRWPEPGTFGFDAAGRELASGPIGMGVLDRTGSVFVVRNAQPGGEAHVAFLDLVERRRHSVFARSPFAIVYRLR